MRIKQNQTTYHCGYCSEYYLVKRAAERHEQFCHKNPSNMHKCFQQCVHLSRWKDEQNRTVFECKKLNKEMYSYILERRITASNNALHVETYLLNNEERMPLECDHYQYNTNF